MGEEKESYPIGKPDRYLPRKEYDWLVGKYREIQHDLKEGHPHTASAKIFDAITQIDRMKLQEKCPEKAIAIKGLLGIFEDFYRAVDKNQNNMLKQKKTIDSIFEKAA